MSASYLQANLWTSHVEGGHDKDAAIPNLESVGREMVMAGATENGRTHEPALRELVSDLDGLRELMNERDRRYTELRKDDQKAVEAALVTAEKATVEFKESQKDYNSSHNGLLQKMDDQHKETLPRLEADAKFQALTTKDEEMRRDMLTIREELRREYQRQNEEIKRDIQSLRESRSETSGTKAGASTLYLFVVVGLGVFLSFISIMLTVILHFIH